MIQKNKPCGTCPWVPNVFGDCFDPNTLVRTVVADILEDRLQSCHGNHNHACAGALAFAKRRAEIFDNCGVRVAAICGIIDPDKIDDSIETFDSIDDMLLSHARRSGKNVET